MRSSQDDEAHSADHVGTLGNMTINTTILGTISRNKSKFTVRCRRPLNMWFQTSFHSHSKMGRIQSITENVLCSIEQTETVNTCQITSIIAATTLTAAEYIANRVPKAPELQRELATTNYPKKRRHIL